MGINLSPTLVALFIVCVVIAIVSDSIPIVVIASAAAIISIVAAFKLKNKRDQGA